MFSWSALAKHFVFLKNIVAQHKKQKKQSHCKYCKVDFLLHLYEKIPFKDLVNHYRLKITGLPFRKHEWLQFYIKHQIFQTLCFECLQSKIEQRRVMLRQRNNTLRENKLKTVARKVMVHWLLSARARALHKVK